MNWEWQRDDAAWVDLGELVPSASGSALRGDVRSDGGSEWFAPPFVARYLVEVGPDWLTQSATLSVTFDDGTTTAIGVSRDTDGTWVVDGQPAPALDGATDVDIYLTPATNLMPIRRLGAEVGASVEIVAAFLGPADDDPARWTAIPSRQRYTRLSPAEVLFESIEPDGSVGFEARLAVTADGVRRYGDHWHATDRSD
jgi:uncharacterized protein